MRLQSSLLLTLGMFTINFKREFVRCCCCLKSSWKRHKLQRLTGKFQTSTGIQRGPVSQTASNNSCRSLQGTNVVKFCDDPALWRNGGGPALSQMNTGSNRANVNNFTKMNLPSLTKTTPNTAPWRHCVCARVLCNKWLYLYKMH